MHKGSYSKFNVSAQNLSKRGEGGRGGGGGTKFPVFNVTVALAFIIIYIFFGNFIYNVWKTHLFVMKLWFYDLKLKLPLR